jgi:hypothetical protein
MFNWNTDTSAWDKKSDSYKVWRLEQLINFGLNGEKLDIKDVKKYWNKIETDSTTRKFLKLIIWGKRF